MKTSYANRGKPLQRLINYTNEIYKRKGWALVDEVPTPTKNIKGRIVYEKKSTVDYHGITHGRALAFDAKSCRETTRFPIKNIHEHQINYLKRFQDQGGISFFIIEFAKKQEFYYVPFDFVYSYWIKAQEGGKKSIPYEDIHFNCELIKSDRGVALDYLKFC